MASSPSPTTPSGSECDDRGAVAAWSIEPSKSQLAGDVKKSRGGKDKPKKKSAAGGAKPAQPARRPKLVWRARDSENSQLFNLQLDLASLKNEQRGLLQYRQMLMNRALNRSDDPDGSYVRVVQEFFKIFHHGYTPPPPPSPDGAIVRSRRPKTATPDAFLPRVMDVDVVIGRFLGLAALMEQVKLYPEVFGPLTLSLLDSQIIATHRGDDAGARPQALVTSRVLYMLTISMRTVEFMFPHILPYPDIVSRILGHRLCGVGRFDFTFDTLSGRIVRYDSELDFTVSFLDVLKDPRLVAFLLHGAPISGESFIGDLSDFEPVRVDQRDEDATASSSGCEEVLMQDDHAVALDRDEAEPEAPPCEPWKMKLSSILSVDDTSISMCDAGAGDVGYVAARTVRPTNVAHAAAHDDTHPSSNRMKLSNILSFDDASGEALGDAKNYCGDSASEVTRAPEHSSIEQRAHTQRRHMDDSFIEMP